MRPVNLIPVDERRGEQAPVRTGPFAYVVVGALVALLAGVAAVVLTGNQISDRKAEAAKLRVETAAATARVQRLSAYTQFSDMRQQRMTTVSSLADSRFDWERVIRELSLVLPPDVSLTNLTGTVSPGIQVDNSAGITTRAVVPGPALELLGCAPGQEAVASLVAALHDIDGVTRVGVASSTLPSDSSAGSAASSGTATSDCQARDFLASFSIVVAFDAAPVPASAITGETVAPPTPTGEAASTSDTASSAGSSADGSATDSGSGDSSAATPAASTSTTAGG